VEGLGFELVCRECLASRGVLESESLPERCPACGAADPWVGPYATTRFARERGEGVADSPFYLGASGSQAL